MTEIAAETEADAAEVEWLYDLCFAPGRTALSSYRLREGASPAPELSRVLRDETGALVGAIRYWPIVIGDAPALLLGPVAVHPTRQGEGLGGLLIEETLDVAAKRGWARVVLIGDEPYYRRFGFVRAEGLIFPPPTNPARLLTRTLTPGAWDGIAGEARPWAPQNH